MSHAGVESDGITARCWMMMRMFGGNNIGGSSDDDEFGLEIEAWHASCRPLFVSYAGSLRHQLPARKTA